ncbi:hypothetical protein [Mycobacteroides abscessus]|uniref:hypothetical protein n=1 Tax=Mycobacteroides abscessus TaxID=36809 RepID=UPI000C25F463|nr:hypothetical protein [Mycobacteroides abscessus]
MNRTKSLTAAGLALAAAVTVAAACGTGPSQEAAPSSRAMMPILDAATVPSGMNPDMAAGSAHRGHPFVAAAGSDCRIWMRLPSGQVWSMPPLSAVNRTGVRMQLEKQADYAKSMYSNQCKQTGPAPESGASDPAAVAAARADGVPYIATSERWDDGCHAWIRLPDGSKWGITSHDPVRGAPSTTGTELVDDTVDAFGCGYGRALPGQASAPKGN